MYRLSKTCLNGWWDFLPVYSEKPDDRLEPGEIPAAGWHEKAFLVPSSWARPESLLEEDKQTEWTKWEISDNFAYPREWSLTRTAWARTTFRIDRSVGGRIWKLIFNAVMPECRIFVNGEEICANEDRTMRFDADFTRMARKGVNTVCVFMTENRRSETGKFVVFEGGFQTHRHSGIWQDVWLEESPELRISDLAVITSVRKNKITFISEIENLSSQDVKTHIDYAVSIRGNPTLASKTGLISVPAGKSARHTHEVKWDTYQVWSPENPHLYDLSAMLDKSGDEVRERFGFREFWIDGCDFILNGTPVHMRGDGGHKLNFDNMRPEYLRQWFRMLKDCNMNYVRFHTYPHPEIVLEIADEIGILVSHESAWHFGGNTDLRAPELWEHAREHVRGIVKYRKNHPCIILWSVGNETRFSQDVEGTIKLAPVLRAMYKGLDPTRPVYHDGDSSLWDEKTQEVISRHYGVECAGEEWWDKSRPLHVGESSRYHYGQPVENLIFGDDEVYSSYIKCSEAISAEAADIIEQARSNGAGCICPWNLSCLDSYRPTDREITRIWPDYSLPGIKPLRSAPYGPEFNWDEPDGKGYLPGAGFEIIKHACRKIAIIVRERLSNAYEGAQITHTVTVVNDGGEAIRGGTLKVFAGGALQHSIAIDLAAGRSSRHLFSVRMPDVNGKGKVIIKTVLSRGQAGLDRHEREIFVYERFKRKTAGFDVKFAKVLGDGSLKEFLEEHGIRHGYISNLDEMIYEEPGVLIAERNSIAEGSVQNVQMAGLLAKGWKILVMEQTACLFPTMSLDILPVERFHIRSKLSPVWKGIEPGETAYWGGSPYGKKQSDALVAEYMYLKPLGGNVSILADAGNGDFGKGGLSWTPLFEVKHGKGLLLASQLLITGRAGKVPAAEKLLLNMLDYLRDYRDERFGEAVLANDDGEMRTALNHLKMRAAELAEYISKPSAFRVMLVNASKPMTPETESYVKMHVLRGGTALLWNTTAETAPQISLMTGADVRISGAELREAYSVIRNPELAPACEPVIDGISHHELFWFEKVIYAPTNAVNRVIARTLLDSGSTGLEPILTSERFTCWREFFTQGGGAEPYRMPVVTHYLKNGDRPYGIALAATETRENGGRFILCQLSLPAPDYEKKLGLWTYLLDNLGVLLPDSILEGEKVAGGLKLSNGCARRVFFIVNPVEEQLRQMLELSIPTEYRMPNQVLQGSFPWGMQRLSEGNASIKEILSTAYDFLSGSGIVIMFQVRPGRPRKLVEPEGGLSDSSLQTFLRLQGSGTLSVYVNGRDYGKVALNPKTWTLTSPIDLESDWNSCILYYVPTDIGAELLHQWRNNIDQPETQFSFR